MSNKKRSLIGIIIALIAAVFAGAAMILSGGENIDYVRFGVIIGVLIGIIIVFLILVVTKNNDNIHAEYDERQEAVRGRAYKYGFFTLLVYFGLVISADISEIVIPVEISVVGFFGLMLGVAVMITVSIMNDAYYSLNENKSRVIGIFIVIAIINLGVGIYNLAIGDCITDGKLNFRFVNMICGILFLYLFVVMGIKSLKDKKEEAE